VPLESTKIDVHRRIALAGSVDDLRELRIELADRFGPPPEPVENLLLLQEARLKLGRLEADYVSIRGNRATIGKLVMGPSELRAVRNEFGGASYVSAAREVALRLSKPGAVKEVLDLVDAIVSARRAA
jgi:transcription-repair coupling factor (superfamily II helicase)